MALIRMEHTPQTVQLNLPLNIILPEPGEMGSIPVRQRKVLYLLHGLSEDATAWQRYTNIEEIASAYGLVVVMPSAGRSFYIDQPNGQRYFTYITEELPCYLSDVFNLAPSREDTMIVGTSMGGYGAFKAALLRPELYGAAASFSGALSLEILKSRPGEQLNEFTHLFGDLNQISGGPHDPVVWLREAAKNPSALPRLFITCGRQDDLYSLSVMFRFACQELGVDVDYHEEDGKHVWPFWETQIKRFLGLVLGQPSQGS